jgi:hypothetical protein
MGRTLNLGERIELVAMDRHAQEISVGLYRPICEASQQVFHIHSYSSRELVADRMEFIRQAMITLGGMIEADGGFLQFPCGAEHNRGVRRLFLDVCKVEPTAALNVRDSTVFDKKSDATVTVTSAGDGRYVFSSDSDSKKATERASAIARGMAKLAELEVTADDTVQFSCGHCHDELVAQLLIRAVNVRAALREQEAAAARGNLAAPSQQR